MSIFEVGKPYHPNRTRWPQTAQYNFMANEHHLHLFMPQPTIDEIAAVREGEYAFALVVEQPAIFLLYRFGQAIPWSDAVYDWHRVPADQRTQPPGEAYVEGTGVPLTIVLTDATTGIVQTIRVVGLGTNLTNALHTAIRTQVAATYRQLEFDEAISRTYKQYRQSAQMLSLASARWPETLPARPTPRGRPR